MFGAAVAVAGSLMTEMRIWLDKRRVVPGAFHCRAVPGGVQIEISFGNENDAIAAGKSSRGSRSPSDRSLIRQNLPTRRSSAAPMPVPISARDALGACRRTIGCIVNAPASEWYMTKILVIDDDAVVRTTIEQILEVAGYQVLCAEDGVRGMAVFRNEAPDLIITGIITPEQEGIQTITEMRKEKPDAKIIAISGGGRVANTDFLRIARALGAMGAIAKPFDADEFLPS
jgi:CheY-like chemotaxis protein